VLSSFLATATVIQAQGALLNNPYNAGTFTIPSDFFGYSVNPYGGGTLAGDYLRGVAEVTRSQGQWLIYKQAAISMKEDNRQKKLETRRLELEQWAWERDFRNEQIEKERQRLRAVEIERARTDPPLSEILEGVSLNVLLRELKKNYETSAINSTKIEEEWLPHIHVTYIASGAGGNVGLLKRDVILWPLLFRSAPYTKAREEINQLIAQAKKEALAGGATAETLIAARRAVEALEARLAAENRTQRHQFWSHGDYINANRALRDFKAALMMLEREDAKFYLNPLQGKTVAELVEFMKVNGLSFAKATAGDERFYVALHRAMAQEAANLPGGR
jgi:hypothetical protein